MLWAAVQGEAAPRVVRGQSPYGSEPLYTPGGDSTTTLYPETYAPEGTTPPINVDPYGDSSAYYQGPAMGDPWQTGGAPAPYAVPPTGPGGFYTYGVSGPQPFRYGFTEQFDVTYLPDAGTNPDFGDFSIFEMNFAKEFNNPIWNNWVFTFGPQLNYRAWEGPSGTAGGSHLPGSVYRGGLNLALATPISNGLSAEFSVTPAIATDFEASFGGDALFIDAKAVGYWQWGPQWTWVLGLAYWDRVDDIFVPHVGFVWTPNDYWAFRLVYPNPEISYFLGTPGGVATWVYVGARYNVEAYYIEVDPPGADTTVQYEDWRVFAGIRWEVGQYTSFIEAGGAFNRDVEFESVGTDFDVDDGFFARVGLRW